MSNKLSDLSSQFLDPPVSSRPLAITHAFDRLLKNTAKTPAETGWTKSADPEGELHSDLSTAIEKISAWGFGGVVANASWHNYLQDREKWQTFVDGAKLCWETGLRVWIYDEEGYPSGGAGGLVLREHPEFEAQVLVRKIADFPAGTVEFAPPSGWRQSIRATAFLGGEAQDITDLIGDDGVLRWMAPCECRVERYDVQTSFEGSHVTNRQVHCVRKYINVLDPAAVQRFCELTHKAYADKLGSDFGRIEAFFTDEPLMLTAYFQDVPEQWKQWLRVEDVPETDFDRLPRLPWRHDLPQVFIERWGYGLLPHIRSLFAGEDQHDHKVRHDFHQMIAELYSDAFFGTLQRFLDASGIALSGHVLFEEPIIQHVATQGSLFAHLRKMNKPGIDLYTSRPDRIMELPYLLTPKYGSSAAHISGKHDIMSETSDWVEQCEGKPTTMAERRCSAAIQSALGITTFTSYFTWDGFDACEVKEFLRYCGRLHQIVRHGTHVAPVAVLYPIRSAWAHYLPTNEILTSKTQPEPLASLDDSLYTIARKLLDNNLDFDFIDSEALTGAEVESGTLKVADEAYNVLVIPPGCVLCPRDMKAVERFVAEGGSCLAFTPLSDTLLNGGASETPQAVVPAVAAQCPDRVALLSIQDEWIRVVDAHVQRDILIDAGSNSVLLRQSRFDDGDMFLLVNPSKSPVSITVTLATPQNAEVWDPGTGEVSPFAPNLVMSGYGALAIANTRLLGSERTIT